MDDLASAGVTTEPSLDDIREDAWEELRLGVDSARHPFHTGVLGTSGAEGPELRTVVLREADRDARVLLCHTDLRSGKLSQLEDNTAVSWLFYDTKRKLQLRLSGSASIHSGDSLSRGRWQQTKGHSRLCYAADPAPGTPIADAGSGLPESFSGRSPTEEESDPWFARFAVILCEIDRMDWLKLAARGHRRARFDWRDTHWAATWVVP